MILASMSPVTTTALISRPGKGTMIFVDAAELLDELRTGYE
jgi:hypothetical protein